MTYDQFREKARQIDAQAEAEGLESLVESGTINAAVAKIMDGYGCGYATAQTIYLLANNLEGIRFILESAFGCRYCGNILDNDLIACDLCNEYNGLVRFTDDTNELVADFADAYIRRYFYLEEITK